VPPSARLTLTVCARHEAAEPRAVRCFAVTRRAWVAYFSTFGALTLLSIGYGLWRESTLEPFTATIDLSRAERHTFRAAGFFPSDYHFGLRVYLPEGVTPERFWFAKDPDTQIWGANPPIIEIEVVDDAGKVVFRERSAIEEAQDWAFSGAIHGSLVEIYKFREFRGRLFGSYKVSITVIRPSQTVSEGEAFLSVVKAYVLLPNALLTVGLVLLAIAGLAVIAVIMWVGKRKRT